MRQTEPKCAYGVRPSKKEGLMSSDKGKIIPSEDWPPYKWLWTRFGGRPWTHIMRDNPKSFLAVFIPVVLLLLFWNGWKYWKTLLIFAVGFLTGHVWW